MLVSDILARKPERIISVDPGATLQHAVEVMSAERIGSLLILDATGGLAGILTERDVVKIMAQATVGQANLAVGAFATRNVVTCRDDNTLEDVLTVMSNNTIRHLPVLRDGVVAGMISARDLLDAQKEDLLAALTRQKQAVSLMQRAKDQAEQADRTKTEFLQNMSHELRTPLNAIVGFSEIISSQSLGRLGNDRYVDMAREVSAAGMKLRNLIDDILAMTRLEAGKWPVSDNDLDVAAVIADCVAEFADRARDKDVALDAVLPNASIRLVADSEMVVRMLDNLISNAVKFTPSGGAITVRAESTPDAQARIAVTDTGIGIAPNALERILTPFGQADGSLTRGHDGTGLGLALVKRMIEAHEGVLDISSAPGQGTTVTLSFPARRVTLQDPRARLAG